MQLREREKNLLGIVGYIARKFKFAR